jgi:hypothetical protein
LSQKEVCTEAEKIEDDVDPFNGMKIELAEDGRVIARNEVEATPDFRDWLKNEWLGGNDNDSSSRCVAGPWSCWFPEKICQKSRHLAIGYWKSRLARRSEIGNASARGQ